MVADFAVAGGKDVFRLLQRVGAVVARSEHFAILCVEDIVVTVARVDAQRTGGGLEYGLQARSAVLLRGLFAQCIDESGVGFAKRFVHLLVEVVDIKVRDAGHQKRADHRHQGGDEQQHDHHELHVQAAEHGRYSFRGNSASFRSGRKNSSRHRGA